MKIRGATKPFFRIILVALVTLAIQIPLPFARAAGKLVLEPMEFDCGVVEEGTPAVMRVRVQNEGDSPVLIQNVQTN